VKYRHVIAFAAVFVAVAVGVYGFAAYRKPVAALTPQVPVTVRTTAAGANLDWPARGEAAVGAVGYGILATRGTQKALPTASVAKTMLALAVLKKHPLSRGQQGPTLTMTQADVDSYDTYVSEDGSVAKVVVGEKITEYQALEALLLPSADNMADTLARWSYGSISAYSNAANGMATSLGMDNTHFGTVDASGLSPTTTSTAHDLVLLGQAAIKNPVIAQIVDKSYATIPVTGTMHNYNWLLGSYGVNGIKTGNSDQAGGVFLFSAKKTFKNGQSVTIVGAIMDTSATLDQAIAESEPLVTSAEAGFTTTTLIHAGQVMGTYDIPWAGSVNAVADKSISAVTWHGQNITPTVSLGPLRTPIVKGAQVGTVTFPHGLGSTPITISDSVTAPSWHWRLLHAF
jgi:serine-type D-Ala-D-Ala carboxypeptidase (penicillin-binding protein 5/6)